jgi:hypothetical protein
MDKFLQKKNFISLSFFSLTSSYLSVLRGDSTLKMEGHGLREFRSQRENLLNSGYANNRYVTPLSCCNPFSFYFPTPQNINGIRAFNP